MRKDMKRKNDRLVALLGAVLCVCACLVGCERKETVLPEPSESNASSTSTAPVVSNAPAARQVASRASDAAYQAQVTNHIAEQRRTNVARDRIFAQMEQLREHARKALPKGATEEQVTAELESNPRKYPGWRELVMALEKNAEKNERNHAAARATVRRRIQREAAEQTSAKQ